MRTNIVLNDELITEAMQLSGITTKRSVVEAALQAFIRLQRQRAVLGLEGAIAWEGDLHQQRGSRRLAEPSENYDASAG